MGPGAAAGHSAGPDGEARRQRLDLRPRLAETGGMSTELTDAQVEADLAPPQPAEDAFGIWKPGDN